MSLCAIEKVCTEILFGILCQLTDLFVFCLPLIYFYLFFDLIVLLDFFVLALSEAKVLVAVFFDLLDLNLLFRDCLELAVQLVVLGRVVVAQQAAVCVEEDMDMVARLGIAQEVDNLHLQFLFRRQQYILVRRKQ